MSRLRTLYGPPAGPPPDTRNHAGFPAFTPTDRHAVAELLLLGTLGPTFYADAEHWATVTADTAIRMAASDPDFLARAAVLAREQGYVRSAPLVALVALASGPPPAQALARRIWERIIRTTDDLRHVIALAQSQRFRPGYGGLVQRLAKRWLNDHLTEYQAVKYDERGRLSLRNILRMTHPRPTTPERQAVYRWVVRREVDPQWAGATIRALAALSAGELDPAAAIRAGHLPFEAVMPRVRRGDAPVWRALLEHAPYQFLLRSLAAMGAAGVWADPDAVAQAATRIRDPEAVRRAMIWPFQLWQAVRVLQAKQAPSALIEAVYDALEASLAHVPAWPTRRLAIGLDVSGSMRGTAVTGRTSAAVIGGLFTAALWKRNPDARVLPFGTDVLPLAHLPRPGRSGPGQPLGISPRDSLVTLATVLSTLDGGGTDLSAPIRQLVLDRHPVDVYIGLTDSEDWAASGGWHGNGFLAAWQHYRATIAPQAQAILIQLVPSGTRVAPSEMPGVRYIYGWSDTVLRYLDHLIAGRDLVALIESVAL